MADYDQLVEKAISKLDDKSPESRQKLYARIRSALVKHFEESIAAIRYRFLGGGTGRSRTSYFLRGSQLEV